MVTTGLHCEGFLEYPVQELANGMVMPDVSVETLQARQREAIRTQVALSRRAEQAGYDYTVCPENHFDLFTRSSSDPVVTQTAIAAHTDTLRLIQVANSLPRHDPVRLAERTATLDAISGGRVDVGLVSGSDGREAALFEPAADTETLFEEYAELLAEAWNGTPAAYDGETYQLPPEPTSWDRADTLGYLDSGASGTEPDQFVDFDGSEPTLRGYPVTPQPTQEPHPQRWRATAWPEGAAWAARHGMNVVTYAGSFSHVAELIEAYYEAAEEAGWPDRRPAHDGEPFDYGWDADRRRGVIAEVELFDTAASGESGLDEWLRGTEVVMSGKKAQLPPEDAEEFPVDADVRVASGVVPIVGGSAHIAGKLSEMAEVCGYEDFAVFPSMFVPGMSRDTRIEQLEAFATEVVPRIEW